MNNKLTNNKKVQVVSLKLDKTKPRELAFRVFLDKNKLNGINRKETILRMFEILISQKEDIFINKYIDNDNNSTQPKEINTVKINNTNSDISDWIDI